MKKIYLTIASFALVITAVVFGSTTAYANTESDYFYITGGSAEKVEMVEQKLTFKYSADYKKITLVDDYIREFIDYYQLDENNAQRKFKIEGKFYVSGGNAQNYYSPVSVMNSYSFIFSEDHQTITFELPLIIEPLLKELIDVNNPAKTFTFSATPGDTIRPGINGNENFASDIDNPTLVADFVKEIKAIDDIDGDISHKIIIESDNYTGKKVIGNYDVNLSVTDSSGNKSTFQFWVFLADITAPSVNADLSTVKISYNQTYDLATFQNTIVATDNYYNASDITIVKTTDNYTANKNKLGTYDVIFTITDKSNNYTEITKKIQVVDAVKPVINGTKVYEKSYTQIITTADILAALTASDEIDGDISNKFIIESDNYTGNANKPSKDPYQIVVSVTDTAGNKQTAEITIKVIDDKSAEWYITNGVTINLPKDTLMTRQQIIDLLAAAGRVNISQYSLVTYTSDTYSANIGRAGLYQLAFKVKEQNGNQADYQFAVNVMGNSDDDTDVVPKDDTIIDKAEKFIVDNKIAIIASVATLIIIVVLVGKVKDQVEKNKYKKRRK